MPREPCTPLGPTSCCFTGRAATIAIQGEGRAAFADGGPLSEGRAAHVDLLGARIGAHPGPEIRLVAPALLEPLPMSLKGQAYTVTYTSGPPLSIVLDLPFPPRNQASSTTFRGAMAEAPACATTACPVTWNGPLRTVRLQRAETTERTLTGRFPYQPGVGHVAKVRIDGAVGTLRCNGDGGTFDEPVAAAPLAWTGRPDGALEVGPLWIEGDALGVAVKSSAPPERETAPTSAVPSLPPPVPSSYLQDAGAAGTLIAVLLAVLWLTWLRRRAPSPLVLHLSDLHFGTEDDAVLWSSQLLADLRGNLGCKRLDAVILSGDVANRSTPEEYAAARTFLDRICGPLGVPRDRVILAPGNHDLDWGRSKLAYQAKAGVKPREGVDYEENGQVHVRDDARYPARFEPFADFYQAVRGEPYPMDPTRQATVHRLPGLNLLVLGLNSAYDLDHHFKARAGIHQLALAAALDEIAADPACAGLLKIAVWHHPVNSASEDRITDHGFLERLADAGFRLALHGHVHRADNSLYRYDVAAGGRRLEIVTAGTFGAPVREWVPGFPLQYQLLRFEGTTLTVETRRREALNGAWKPDARWTPAGGRDPAPRYTRALG